MKLRLLKLGGSLLDLPQLADRFGCWLVRQEPRVDVMVVGGGALADAIRAADRIHGLGEAAAHALCLECMGVTSALAREIFTGSQLRTQAWQIERDPNVPLQILDVRSLLDEPPSEGLPALPHSWQATSDSIAAQVAHRLGADELVLLKSVLPASAMNPQQAVDLGLVDAYFPAAIGKIRVRVVNLRDPQGTECELRSAEASAAVAPR